MVTCDLPCGWFCTFVITFHNSAMKLEKEKKCRDCCSGYGKSHRFMVKVMAEEVIVKVIVTW